MKHYQLIKNNDGITDLEAEINTYALQGYKVVGFSFFPEDDNHYFVGIAIMEREVPDAV
jgi:hypothetical protein